MQNCEIVELWMPWISFNSCFAASSVALSFFIKMFRHVLAPFPWTLWNCETYQGACKCRWWNFWSLLPFSWIHYWPQSFKTLKPTEAPRCMYVSVGNGGTFGPSSYPSSPSPCFLPQVVRDHQGYQAPPPSSLLPNAVLFTWKYNHTFKEYLLNRK